MSVLPGVYGLQIEGLARGHTLSAAPSDWPTLRVSRSVDPEVGPGMAPLRVRGDQAEADLADGVHLTLWRDPLSARLVSTRPLTDEALLHPYLALPALIANYWLGRQVLHGGAFALEGRAWGILGNRLAGKSSTLAALLNMGVAIISDDVLVIDQHELFSGPPSVDLREQAFSALGGEPMGVLGNRERYRLRSPPAPLSLPLGGFVVLDWGPDVSMVELSILDRIRAMADSSEIALNVRSADSLLALAQMPVVRLSRPRDLAVLPEVVAQLLTRLSEL